MSLPIFHLKGWHASLFPMLVPAKSVAENFRFRTNCVYNFDGSDDQWDWNKLCGLDFTLPLGERKAVMVGWRWNPIRSRFELSLYVHDPVGGRFMSDPLARVCEWEPFGIRLSATCKPSSWRLSIWQRDAWSHFDHEVSFNEILGRPVSGWFGGDKPAPHFMQIDRGVNLG